MKKIILSIIASCIIISALAQDSAYKQVQPFNYGASIQAKPLKNSPDYFLRRSEKEKNAATVLMGLGVLFSAVGWIWYEEVIHKDYTLNQLDEGVMSVTASHTLAVGGLCMIAGSIPLFILAGHDRKRAGTLSANFQMMPYQSAGHTNVFIKRYPAIGFVVNL